jgi:hypothetical protein
MEIIQGLGQNQTNSEKEKIDLQFRRVRERPDLTGSAKERK